MLEAEVGVGGIGALTTTVQDYLQERKINKDLGAPGFEPGTSRSAGECSITELHPSGHRKPMAFPRKTGIVQHTPSVIHSSR